MFCVFSNLRHFVFVPFFSPSFQLIPLPIRSYRERKEVEFILFYCSSYSSSIHLYVCISVDCFILFKDMIRDEIHRNPEAETRTKIKLTKYDEHFCCCHFVFSCLCLRQINLKVIYCQLYLLTITRQKYTHKKNNTKTNTSYTFRTFRSL